MINFKSNFAQLIIHFVQTEAKVLYTALIDRMETADTAVPCSQFPNYLLEIKPTILEQYKVMFHIILKCKTSNLILFIPFGK